MLSSTFRALVAVVATVMVITRLNAVHALLYLIVSLLAVAVVFFTLGAPFVAALEVIIYAGAIMVLFVFVVMMLNLGPAQSQERQLAERPEPGSARPSWRRSCWPSWSYILARGRRQRRSRAPRSTPSRWAWLCIGPYLLGVELASMLLLAGLVGAYHLGRRKTRGEEERRE